MRTSYALLVSCLAVTVMPPPAIAKETAISSTPLSNASVRKVEEYWTEERMRQATEKPLPAVSDEEYGRISARGVDVDRGTSRTIESSHSELAVDASGANEYPQRGDVIGANVSKRPYWNGGKFFYTEPGVGDFVCTAAFVGHRRVVMTAASCLMNRVTGQFYTNFHFVQGYANGRGTPFHIDWATVWSDWIVSNEMEPTNFSVDYGFLVTGRDTAAGYLGLRTHLPYQGWWSIGYPRNYGGSGFMQVVGGSAGEVGNTVQMQGNAMAGGAGGGPWIAEVTGDPGRGNYAIGVNAFTRSEQPGSMYGPYFDDRTLRLFEIAKGNMQ